MKKTTGKYANVKDYINGQPSRTQTRLKEMRRLIRKVVPEAEEIISYSIPAFRLNGLLVWYAGFKEHIGFYPRASAIAAFARELSSYKSAKGSVRFPIDRPLPSALIQKIVAFRVRENELASLRHRKPAKRK